ncbi:hypothetical protein OIU84_022518 [Salix udensis]|uniref:Dolichol phosphate-mannose biosynthesis regulatory protein n=1 Tax=Salix udensis TaxID=889485 RepID=A0AAD6KNU7_9ROSI|nr:hypothetical protein OIU84_022518 [Salix udensis]
MIVLLGVVSLILMHEMRIGISTFTYYTFWVIILPFVDSDHFVHQYFLPQEYAILVPVFAGVALLCFLCVFVGFVMLKSKKKKA